MTRRVSLVRIAAVTGALIGVGAVVGAVMGALLTLMAAARGFWPPGEITGLAKSMTWGATYGAPVGAVLTPVLSWLFLQRVPLGRALLETAMGTLVGAGVALLVDPFQLYLGAILGFLVAGVGLYVRTRRKRSRVESPLIDV